MKLINMKKMDKELDALHKYFLKRKLTNGEVTIVMKCLLDEDISIGMLDIVDEKLDILLKEIVKEVYKNGRKSTTAVKKRKKRV